MSTISDQHYIDKVLQGETNAFAVLVDRYKDMIFTLALKMVKNREEAEEVSQDTFIKIYSSLNKFKGESKFSTWIYKIAYNTCLDRLKKSKKEDLNISIDDFSSHLIKTMETALSVLEDKERKQTIQNCLNLLPSEENFLLTLFYFENQNLEEIGKIMSINANNVKVKLFRSRQKLAVILKKQLEPEIIEYYERGR
ncbi:RNA polymerase, sigma subunit, ECF family [Flavobacterium sp. CF108]|jgi:RNA polymerase sigma-70 factor (ECF subfamily)|uniref:RNA polymerase sigma factor n=1 Tax=unclassified Flavobacterium TaxID=196869 RepID=UPI0008B33F64|nr:MULTISPECIES: sigma-70 family RNA polymerase sigma factor [unclassified Flavobacterium]SEN63423.1 RNA polymerase sigma-70 factor, ECF subfamily [Flavobacterium sp. fv08]SHH05078.1 RNA polymerase, sigma subunit, ECF family [Flavobacterium sp. CF108]